MIDLTYEYVVAEMKDQLLSLRSVQEREGPCRVARLPCCSRGAHVASPTDALVSLLATLPRSSIANIQTRLGPLLRLDILGVRS